MRTTSRNKRGASSGWSLYWVSSDGEEDCFVVARNSRSAKRLEIDYCGFYDDEVDVTRIKPIPKKTLRDWEKRRGSNDRPPELPWYADHWLLRRLGASFRDREELSETLIDDVVYTNGPDGPIAPRVIGRRGLNEFKAVKAFQRYGHEDRYTPPQMTLLSMLGICVARTQEIEYLIAHSFLLGALHEPDRRKNLTIAELIKNWEKKTLGQMLRAMESCWDIDPMIHTSLKLFLEMRNQLIHGLTTSEQYSFTTSWGQDEAVGFLAFFEIISRPIREAFRASFYASIDFGNTHFLKDDPEKIHFLNSRQQRKIGLFAAFFHPKKSAQ